MSPSQIAFFIGSFGSVHCIGMCGPLALAIPINHSSFWLLLWDKLVYNLGRTISYATLGLITGLIGKQLWLSGLQQGVSIISGILILLAAGSRLWKLKIRNKSSGNWLLKPFNALLTYALQHRAGHLAIGLLNGFLPCGFVYLALIGAVNTSSVGASVQYMIWFGLGTLPLMLAVTVGSGFVNQGIRRKMNRMVPYFMLCLGVWFLLRGLALDIPYLSPPSASGIVICK
ncbi:sulfite exporter TauE/SafE family protein [Mucilaginibacter sp. SJ]|uniref:sulfite exporter TauE/SafE family protein n=1 Tax=Mucilaginibacter sp. SJ TaxID=3029053 RepID=UPI0023A9FC68|nr:sulfite exporter TauE/SafE family protein [Mucilaginibacter sp. SJ]WEA00448.1 sulfite exporter TauE/SafE family protein [Mucilaginibacter sp. SJ]